MTFAQPYWLLLLLLLPWLMFQYRMAARKRHVTLQVSRLQAMRGVKTWVVYARNWIQYIRWVVIALVVVAMARPQLLWHEDEVVAESVDIMLVMDVSPSMLSKDFRPDRLTVAKEMAVSFVNRRPYDQLGLVLFSGGAFTQCPLTSDRRILQAFINNIQVGRLPDGTAIGMGIATALRHLDKSKSKGKMVLLITDGEHNAGDLGPLTAAAAAKALGIPVYAIGLGSDGLVLSPTQQGPLGTYSFATREMKFDTKFLEQLSELSGGKFYRAKTTADLADIYDEVENLEKTKVVKKSVKRTSEMFFWFLNAAFCLLLLELSLRWGPLRVITV
ncbi:MAG: VWA domain-containing protein [Saprospiraceae bacterium]|nr:VWA domain-containing protein [Saprospiraceae bacterium]